MSILNGVVAMNLDSTGYGYEEPSTPLRDPASSPVVHIQWQNSQSACAALEELRVASSVPRHPPPKPLTFDFELPARASGSAAEPSSSTSTSDPFLTSRTTRTRTMRALGRVQSHSQSDVFAIPATDASKFLYMLGRASARVDENSRRRMKRAREFELRNGRDRAARTQITSSPSSVKGKGKSKDKGKGKARERIVTRSMDELGDHTNLLRDDAHRFSSLPIMETKDTLLSQKSQPGSMVLAGTGDPDGDVHMHVDDPGADANVGAPAPGDRRIKSPASTDPPKNRTRHPPTKTTTHPQKRTHAEVPSPTLPRSAPTPTAFRPGPVPVPGPSRSSVPVPVPLKPNPTPPNPRPPSGHPSSTSTLTTAAASQQHHRHHHRRDCDSHHPIPAPTPRPPAAPATSKQEGGGGSRASAVVPSTSQLPPSSQTHGTRRALGMTRSSVPRLSSSPHSAAVKKPFRPPLARAAPVATPKPGPQPQRRQEDRKSAGADPDSSFDISFDFDPEALEAAMKKFD
ncbi:hypothetical protein BC827DRAFT_1156414 [Russula dissimulans]|nr:hypothetical protein BC827DRAFT_1156414 [Russula dissimulans]